MKHQQFDNRQNSGLRGYNGQWQKVRNIKISNDPLCEQCINHGIDEIATIVHHIKSIEDAPELRLRYDNLMSLCTQCHEEIHGRLVVVGCDVNGMPISSKHGWNKP
jgi:5-methylcytosine-specific restriction enzyme A